MALAVGTRLGPYEIQSQLGAGGMGEVYKATDTRLDRTVAIKVLLAHVADDPDLRQRFEREAKTISSLNHPHICTLHDIGQQDGIDYLVMEYLEGETLAARLTKGPLPTDQVLRYATEIADALDKAHRKGITHRDLKPGNIMITKAGTKLLDFGLAKLRDPKTAGLSLSQRPTESASLTAQGVILGTLQYMAPEQLEGKDADARTDIFAFGAVIYEMATGRKAFEGASQASLITAIMSGDPPPISSLQPVSPPRLNEIVRTCLAKDPDDRWQSAGDLGRQLKIIQGGSQPSVAVPVVPAARQRVGWWQALPWVAGISLAVIVGLAVWNLRPEPPPGSPARFVVSAPPSAVPSQTTNRTELAISPDGNLIVYRATVDSEDGLYVRPVESLEGRLLPGTEGAGSIFFSPDGDEVGFVSPVDGTLKKIRVSGGPTTTLAPMPSGPRGASWGPDDTIIFARSGAGNGLFQVSAAGGEPVMLTEPEAPERHYWPEVLPNGRGVLFTIEQGQVDTRQLAVLDIATGDQRVLPLNGSHPRYLSSGHVVYSSSGDRLWAVAFDADQLNVVGDPIPVLEGVFRGAPGGANVAVSADGSLVYQVSAAAVGARRTLVWVDRQGTEEAVAAEPKPYEGVALSPDGLRVATEVRDPNNQDIYIYDLARETPTRFTLDPGNDIDPIWTPDGARLVWSGFRDGSANVFWKSADGTGEAEPLTSHADPQGASSITPDGKTLLIWQGRANGFDVGIVSLDDPQTIDWLFENPFRFGHSEISPDGRWVAYTSDEEGQDEVYVRPFPNVEDDRAKVSQDGGFVPRWGPDSDELFYQAYQGTDRESGTVTMMMAPINTEPRLRPGTPVALFRGPYRAGELVLAVPRPYDVSDDGQRFLIIKEATGAEAAINDIILVQHFDEELTRLFPTDR